jgi:uncharacterized hydrophobic protein (TIGR00271 family)
VIHVRLVVPGDLAKQVLDLLCASPAVTSVIHMADAAHKPAGDVILADLAREDASVLVSDLKELGLQQRGTIALEYIDSAISEAADAAEKAAKGSPADAVVWEQVEARTSEETELSFSFLAFMVIAMLIAGVGVATDSPILIIGAMVVGPEFGPLAAVCVAIVQRRGDLAKRSVLALAIGFPLGISITYVAAQIGRALDIGPDQLIDASQPLTNFISHPDAFSVIVALLAGTAGMLSLTSAKSGALVGVLISVTTIPAAGNVGTAAAYADWNEVEGAALQLGVNLAAILAAGVTTLFLQRRYYIVRRKRHLRDPIRRTAGLPMGRSARGSVVLSAKDMAELEQWEHDQDERDQDEREQEGTTSR